MHCGIFTYNYFELNKKFDGIKLCSMKDRLVKKI